jgi:replicative DNA helicase
MKDNALDTGGRIPPQNIKAEEAVIVTLLNYEHSRAGVLALIKDPATFYRNPNRVLFTQMAKMYAERVPIDLVTLASALKSSGQMLAVGGEAYLVELIQKDTGATHIEYHCRLVLQEYIKRQIVEAANDMINSGLNPGSDAFELMERYQVLLDGLSSQITDTKSESWQEILLIIQSDIEKLSAIKDGEVGGISTGLKELDKFNAGWAGGELIILAARPGMGKTAMAVKFICAALAKQIPVAVFQLEMSGAQFGKRVLAVEADGLHANQLYKHGLKKEEHWQKFFDVVKKVGNYPLHIVPKPGLSIFECTAEARRLHKMEGIGLIVVDYLQLMSGANKNRNSNREQEISEISRELKALTLELNIPIIALSQLSRAVETRGGTMIPRLSDLRESGSIEQDADAVYFLYRPDYYGLGNNDGLCQVIVAKHRNGQTGTVEVGFDDNKVRFCDLEEMQNTAIEPEF